jgi:hypothetical protein
MDTLQRSKDRKVANAVSRNGKQALIANTFGLPAGRQFSCSSTTATCEKVCYAGKLEKLYKNVKDVLVRNWNLLKDSDHETMVNLLNNMISDFRKDCEKRNAEKLFRIHWDGDFFSQEYTLAWKEVIISNPDIQFWVYTRVQASARTLHKSLLSNLSLYFSTDQDNLEVAKILRSKYGIKLAYLADNFQVGQAMMKEITGRPGAKCPENAKRLSLISSEGSACVRCGLCVYEKSDIVFSSSKK